MIVHLQPVLSLWPQRSTEFSKVDYLNIMCSTATKKETRLIVEHTTFVNCIPDVAQTPSLFFKEINGINFRRKAN